MKKKYNVYSIKHIALFGIFLLAVFLRFYKLNTLPALNADEAAIGYNAYSLLQTGKDEHANAWPIHFVSFGDYKPGLYFYVVMPFVKFLGLNELSVRIPSAFIGALCVVAIYFLVKQIDDKNEKAALISSFFLAISPWHIHFSRGGWEVNVATFFILTGLFFLLRGIKNSKYLILASILFVLSLYTYHAARIIVPILVLGVGVFYIRDFIKKIKFVLICLIVGVILVLPLGIDLLGPAGMSRAAGVGLFVDTGPINRINEQRGEYKNISGIVPRLLHNKVVNYGLAFLSNWASHYHGEFLFVSGDAIQRNKVPETGLLYLFDILLIPIGLIYAIKNNKKWLPVLYWLIISPIPAALTFQSPHALRSQNMVIPLIILSALGLAKMIDFIKNRVGIYNIRYTIYVILFVFVGWNFARYIHMYYVHMAKEYSFSSQYSVKELTGYISQNQDGYEKILITDRYDQPYILFLFYMKYLPAKFQEEHVLTPRDQFGFSTVRNFHKYEFRSINFDKDRPTYPDSLIIGTDEEIPKAANVIKTINFPNGSPAFKIVAN